MIFYEGGIFFIFEPTLWELIMRKTCASTSVGLVRILHEQWILCTVEAISLWELGLKTLYWHITKDADGKLSGDDWLKQDISTYTKSVVGIIYPAIGRIQGLVVWHMGFPMDIDTTSRKTT